MIRYGNMTPWGPIPKLGKGKTGEPRPGKQAESAQVEKAKPKPQASAETGKGLILQAPAVANKKDLAPNSAPNTPATAPNSGAPNAPNRTRNRHSVEGHRAYMREYMRRKRSAARHPPQTIEQR